MPGLCEERRAQLRLGDGVAMPFGIQVLDVGVVLIDREVVGSGPLQRDLASEEARRGSASASGASLVTAVPSGSVMRTGGGSSPDLGASTNAARHANSCVPRRGFLPLITLPVSVSTSAYGAVADETVLGQLGGRELLALHRLDRESRQRRNGPNRVTHLEPLVSRRRGLITVRPYAPGATEVDGIMRQCDMILAPRYDGPPILSIDGQPGDQLQPLTRQRRRMEAMLAELADDEWVMPSRCAGWSARDVVAHLVGVNIFWHASVVAGLAGTPTPRARRLRPCGDPIVDGGSDGSMSRHEVLDQFVATNEAFLGVVAELSDDGWSTVAESPAGHVSIRLLAQHAAVGLLGSRAGHRCSARYHHCSRAGRGAIVLAIRGGGEPGTGNRVGTFVARCVCGRGDRSDHSIRARRRRIGRRARRRRCNGTVPCLRGDAMALDRGIESAWPHAGVDASRSGPS